MSGADLILFTATADMSIVSLNLSLMLNNVGFYQVLFPPTTLDLSQVADALGHSKEAAGPSISWSPPSYACRAKSTVSQPSPQ